MISFDFDPDAVILCAGNYPTCGIARNIMDSAKKLICCDGAAVDYINKENKLPWKIIGDGDSLPQDFKTKYDSIYIHVYEQEYNDQTKAIKLAQSFGLQKIAIIGATGKREDHTIGNISLLAEYLEWGIDARIYTDHGMFVACEGENKFNAEVGSAVSVFNFGATEMHSEGLLYPLYDLKKLWQGTLNKTTANPFLIKANGKYIVYLNY